jgi:hypothetical protein
VWSCFGDELKKVAHGADIKYGRYLVSGVPGPTNAHEILATFKENGLSASAYVHAILTQKGRSLVYMVHLDIFSTAFTLSEESALLRRMRARLP